MKMLMAIIEFGSYDDSDIFLSAKVITKPSKPEKVLCAAFEYLQSEWKGRAENCKVEIFVESEKGNFTNFVGECYFLDIMQPWHTYKTCSKKLPVGKYFVYNVSSEFTADIAAFITL